MRKLTTAVAILCLVSVASACSLRPKRQLDWLLVLQVDSSDSNKESAVKQTVAVIETRLNALGVGNYQLDAKDAANGRFRLGLSLASVPEPERLKTIITANGHLELVAVLSPPNPAPVRTYNTKEEAEASLQGRDRAGVRILPYTERLAATPNSDLDATQEPTKWVTVTSPAIVDGSQLRTAKAILLTGRDYQIEFTLKREGAEKFGAWTAANIRNYLGVVLNDEVKSIVLITSQITDTGEIHGKFTKQSAEDLALILQSGALPAPVKIVHEGFMRWN